MLMWKYGHNDLYICGARVPWGADGHDNTQKHGATSSWGHAGAKAYKDTGPNGHGGRRQTGAKTCKDTKSESLGDRRAQRSTARRPRGHTATHTYMKDKGTECRGGIQAQRHVETRGQKVMGTDGHKDTGP